MTAVPPKRPWWRRKRFRAAVVLWLVVAYPLSLGPTIYLNTRGWVPAPVVAVLEIVYAPLQALADGGGVIGEALDDAAMWFDELAERHAGTE